VHHRTGTLIRSRSTKKYSERTSHDNASRGVTNSYSTSSFVTFRQRQRKARSDPSYTWKVGPRSAQRLAGDTRDRSSVEVEQILPSDEHVQDPQDFYTSDSLVLVDFDLDQELYRSAEEFEMSNDLEVQDEHQGSGFAARPVHPLV